MVPAPRLVRRLAALFLAVLFLAVEIKHVVAEESCSKALGVMAELAAFLNPLGISVFRNLHASLASDDVVISPLSIKMCLSMVAHGATKGSVTEKEMMAVIGDWTPVKVDSAIDVANSAWVRGEIKKDYIESIQTNFGAEAFGLTDPEPEPINRWVKERTNGRIEKLFEKLDPLTVLVLVNTVFFKGTWAQPFDAKETREGIFNAFGGKSIPCKMMYKKDKRMMYAKTEAAQIVRLPYASGGMSATIILPLAEGPEALNKVIESLTGSSWAKLDAEVQSGKEHIELRMPRFKVEFGQSLKSSLQELGMPTPFEGEKTGAFLGMSEDPLVHISEVIHKATIEVNEEGTVAAAATGAVMATRSMPPPSVPVTVDRPFLFLITGSDGALMFLAKAVSPTLSV
mmetsp:Transcript_17197/g.30150  ORF Transcript_17197/g.30150 Transcript_17197/m.30150 type:complete len:399 (+) Transcript_17197:58-1254(+)